MLHANNGQCRCSDCLIKVNDKSIILPKKTPYQLSYQPMFLDETAQKVMESSIVVKFDRLEQDRTGVTICEPLFKQGKKSQKTRLNRSQEILKILLREFLAGVGKEVQYKGGAYTINNCFYHEVEMEIQSLMTLSRVSSTQIPYKGDMVNGRVLLRKGIDLIDIGLKRKEDQQYIIEEITWSIKSVGDLEALKKLKSLSESLSLTSLFFKAQVYQYRLDTLNRKVVACGEIIGDKNRFPYQPSEVVQRLSNTVTQVLGFNRTVEGEGQDRWLHDTIHLRLNSENMPNGLEEGCKLRVLDMIAPNWRVENDILNLV